MLHIYREWEDISPVRLPRNRNWNGPRNCPHPAHRFAASKRPTLRSFLDHTAPSCPAPPCPVLLSLIDGYDWWVSRAGRNCCVWYCTHYALTSHFFAVSAAFNLFSATATAAAAIATAVVAAAAQFDTIELCYIFYTPFIGPITLCPLPLSLCPSLSLSLTEYQ